MDFRLYSLLYMVTCAYCLGPPGEALAKFNNCPQTSGPSVLEHLDVDNSGVERLVVYFYKARNSHQIVPFIPSREYQNCIEDIAEEAGETLYNYNENSIEGLFNIQEGAIRYSIKPTEIIPDSSLDMWQKPWNKHHIQHGSHERDNTDDTAVVDNNPVDFPEHDNSSPHDVPAINNFDDNKGLDWHIPVEKPDVQDIPWRPPPSSHEYPDEFPEHDNSSPHDVPAINNFDDNKGLDWHIPVEKPDVQDIPWRPPPSSHEYPDEFPEHDNSSPHDVPAINNFDDNKSPGRHIPVKKPDVQDIPWRPLPSSHEYPDENISVEMPVIGPHVQENPQDLDISVIDPNHHDQIQPIIDEEIERAEIEPSENPIVGPNHHDKLLPITREEIEGTEIGPLENSIIEPNRNDKLPSIIREEIEGSENLENPIVGPHHYEPIIREEIDTLPLRPLDNSIIGPNHQDILGPIIGEETDASPIKPPENHVIAPNHNDILRPIVGEETDVSPLRPLENPIIGPNDNDILRPIIGDETELRPLDNPIIGPNHRDKLPSNGENIDANIDEAKHQSISGEDSDILRDTDHHDSGSRKIKEGLNIDDENINSLIIPKGDHEYSTIEHGDSNESSNSQNRYRQEINALFDKKSLNLPSQDEAGNSRDQLNLFYKWHKVKVPRIDSSGKIYGWIWKSVKSPVRSKSVKWSYWQSSGKKQRLTRWKHKSSSSSSSKVYHHSSNDGISVANFDRWLKNQIRNMESNGNKMLSSDNDINTVKVAIEQTLKTNGIKVKSSGEVIDADGNVLRLDNIQLRPIYIGRSLAFNRILQNSGSSIKYRIPANTPFLEGLLVSLVNPAKTLGIVPLGITALPRMNSVEGIRKSLLGSGRELHPLSIQSGLHKLISGPLSQIGKIFPKLGSKVTDKEESKSLSEEEPEFRIIGGSFAMGSGTPLANRGRSGKD